MPVQQKACLVLRLGERIPALIYDEITCQYTSTVTLRRALMYVH